MLPDFFSPQKVGEVWRVPYQERFRQAREWAAHQDIKQASGDSERVCLLLIDVQNTFCIPGFELFVGGRSGNAAVEDNRRLCEFIYNNLAGITQVYLTLDTHQATQIFHSIFLVNDQGEHPDPFTLVSSDDIRQGVWRFNAEVAASLNLNSGMGEKLLGHYVDALATGGKFDLTIWPYHAMLGGIGHALVAAVEEAVFFHGIARCSQPKFFLKGNNPLTENYSALAPEVRTGPEGEQLGEQNDALVDALLSFDKVIIAGQAKSHCVAWTVADLLAEIEVRDASLAGRIHLLEDCTSPVVIPGAIDYTDEADAAFRRFADAGMHIIRAAGLIL